MSRTRQRFEGPSIESALAAAVASLGPDLDVSDARKVRTRGVLGFFAREHYEVLAEPKLSGDSLARAEASLDDTLQSLMAAVEAEETPAAFAASLAAAASSVETPRPEPVEPPPDAPEAPAAPELPAAPPPRPLPEPPAALQPPPPPEPARALPQPPGAAERPLPLGRPGEPRWSRAALLGLGLDERFLARVLVADHADDQAWTMALASAVKTEMVAAETAVPDGSVTVTGTGPAAAIRLINAAACGFPSGRLCLPGGDVPATAMELTLAVRSCLPR